MLKLALLNLFLFSFLRVSKEIDFETKQKLNSLNILLPPLPNTGNWREVTYDMEAYKGCFEWKSDFNSLIRIDQYKGDEKDDNCRNKATVNVLANSEIQNIIWISAFDKLTGQSFKVETRISLISKIRILTKHRVLDIGDTQVLEILAYDKEGNSFSSLNGVSFKWKISSPSNSLEISTITNSLYKSTHQRRMLEAKGFHSDNLIVKGINTGNSFVNVQLLDFDDLLISDSVNITVVQRFKVFPCEKLYFFKGDSFQFQIAQTEISLPDRSYDLEIADSNIGIVDKSGYFKAKSKGKTSLIARDLTTENNTVTCDVLVSEPKSLEIESKEFSSKDWEEREINPVYYFQRSETKFENLWNFIVGRLYYLRAEVFDSSGFSLRILASSKVDWKFNVSCIEIVENRNHEIILKATKNCGIFQIESSISKFALKASKEGILRNPIVFVSKLGFIHLPLLHSSQTPQIFFPTFEEGSNRLSLFIANSTIAGVDQEGFVFPKLKGETELEVRDKLNFRNLLKVLVRVSVPTSLKFLPKHIV